LTFFRVWAGKTGLEFYGLRNGVKSGENDYWYIADLPHIRDSFIGKIPILALEPSDIQEIEPLMQWFEFESRKLSTVAERKWTMKGEETLNQEYTILMGQKAKYISRYVTFALWPPVIIH
jgi:hypothetical protein